MSMRFCQFPNLRNEQHWALVMPGIHMAINELYSTLREQITRLLNNQLIYTSKYITVSSCWLRASKTTFSNDFLLSGLSNHLIGKQADNSLNQDDWSQEMIFDEITGITFNPWKPPQVCTTVEFLLQHCDPILLWTLVSIPMTQMGCQSH